MQSNLPSVEGLTPMVLWYTLVGLVGIGAIIVLGDKVADVFRKRKKRKDEENAMGDVTIQSQLDKISNRLDAIDEYIKESDRKFDHDNRRLNTLEADVEHIAKGINALARAELAHIQHDITGNHTDNLGMAEKEITDYLTRR